MSFSDYLLVIIVKIETWETHILKSNSVWSQSNQYSNGKLSDSFEWTDLNMGVMRVRSTTIHKRPFPSKRSSRSEDILKNCHGSPSTSQKYPHWKKRESWRNFAKCIRSIVGIRWPKSAWKYPPDTRISVPMGQMSPIYMHVKSSVRFLMPSVAM